MAQGACLVIDLGAQDLFRAWPDQILDPKYPPVALAQTFEE